MALTEEQIKAIYMSSTNAYSTIGEPVTVDEVVPESMAVLTSEPMTNEEFERWKRDHECADCGLESPTQFIVNHDLWKSVGVEGMLCLGCFEKRIGRLVRGGDLLECGVTDEMKMGHMILSRE